MASGSSNGEPTTAPQPNLWYDLRLGASCRDPSPTAKFSTLRYKFKPASIDKTQAGSLQSTKDNRVTVEFHNNQPGKAKVTFEGSQEEYKDNDGVLFFDGETFRLERLHRAVKRLTHIRVPQESASTNFTTTTTGMGAESHSPPLSKVGKSQPMSRPAADSVPVEVERIDIVEPENPGPRYNNKSITYQPVTADPFALSSDPKDGEENLDILGDDDDKVNVSPNNMTSGQETSVHGFDINIPNQGNMDDEIADVDVNDEADEGLNAAEALRAHVNAEEQQDEQDTSSGSGSGSGSSSSSSSGSGSGSGSGSSSSDSDGSDGDWTSSRADVDT